MAGLQKVAEGGREGGGDMRDAVGEKVGPVYGEGMRDGDMGDLPLGEKEDSHDGEVLRATTGGLREGSSYSGRKWVRVPREEVKGRERTVQGREILEENQNKRGREADLFVESSKRIKSISDGVVLIPEAEVDVIALRDLIRREAPAILFLCETKLSGREMRRVREKIDGFYGMEVDSAGRSGGLAMMWRKEIDCTFLSASVHYMDFVIKGEQGEWRLTGFYGWPAVSDRHLSWELLRVLSRQSALPWVCIGDFNEILFSTEMKGGSRPQRQMNNFQAAVDDCGLRDVAWEGYNFSFDNGQVGDANRQSMIDRAMCTGSWLDLFPFARLFYLEREWSDHSPIKLVLNRREMEGVRRRQFRFEQFWTEEEGCGEAVERGYYRGRGDLVTMLQACASELRAWKKTNINRIRKDMEKKMKRLGQLNEGDRSEANVRARKKLVAELAGLRKKEEQYWRQRSRALWLKEGDRNTSFFHSRAGDRRRKNFIASLVGDDGTVHAGDEAVSRVANNYFEELFTSSNPVDFDDVLVGLEGRVSADMNMGLSREYGEEEVIEALHQMHPLKAPGPDGMNGLFYQTYWDIVGSEVIATVLAILRGERSPRDINKTNIVLIPKKKAPDKIRDFRPISLCNVAYKLVSKVLANRLKSFLGDIVSVNQSAFTPGRIISDNVLVAFEIFHYMKNSKSTEGHMAIKLDMAKAYDRVEWPFLQRILTVMGFDSAWINRVMECVQTVSFAVLINGTPSREFRPSRGLRQGDPLSPYLFILCAEALSNLMTRAVEDRQLHGVKISPGAPVVSHLLFADDSIFFAKATETEADVIKDVLRRYEYSSGQLVNLDKTTISFSKGVPLTKRSNLATRLGFVEVEEQSKYLGLPTVVGRSKKGLTDIIRDKLSKRLNGWRGKLLSRAGKEVLIKAVANSLPTYVMSVFKLPANFCDELRSIVSRFWWNHEEGKRGISWVAWRKLCQPKCMGGMGFRDFMSFNLALLGKQVWRLVTDPECLWARMMRAKYYPDGSILTADLGHNPSYTWRGLLEARKVMECGLRRRIGDGVETSVWRDAWILGTQSGRVLSPCQQGREEMRVSELLNVDGRSWNLELVNATFLPFERERIWNIRLGDTRTRDLWFWEPERDGVYTVKTAYKLLVGARLSVDYGDMSEWEREKWLWNRLWKVPVWPRIRLFFWQLCSEALATGANIASRVRGENFLCPLCNSCFESSLHLFRDCWVANRVWEGLSLLREEEEDGGRLRDWIEARWREMGGMEHGKFMVGCWAIWECRNKALFEGKEVNPRRVLQRVCDVVEEIASGGFGGKESRLEVKESAGVGNGDKQGWQDVEEGMVKLNVDAGILTGVGVGLGMVCRSNGGRVEWGLSILQAQMLEPHMAEAVAILEGLKEARRKGQDKLVVESDCLQVIDALRNHKHGRSLFHLVLDDILNLCSLFSLVVWSYTSRKNNTVAHALAHTLANEFGRVEWSDNLPPTANSAVLFDLSLMK
ncbi:uncharacterized protein LOC141619219 [Silene latifolia]|uniref:uncharacterized protein LOC141619219 n=2 Tax=Silene latifolia TaxID=37657 RepID=UPI003D78400F